MEIDSELCKRSQAILICIVCQEGISIMESKTADIIHETKKLQIGTKTESFDTANQPMYTMASTNLAQNEAEYETQLKASQKVSGDSLLIDCPYDYFAFSISRETIQVLQLVDPKTNLVFSNLRDLYTDIQSSLFLLLIC